MKWDFAELGKDQAVTSGDKQLHCQYLRCPTRIAAQSWPEQGPSTSSCGQYWSDSLASKYLCAPPPSSSVASERLFSNGGDISTETRNCLLPEKLEQLLFLNKNLRVLNVEY